MFSFLKPIAKFFRPTSTRIIDHPYFGTLVFYDNKEDNYWEGAMTLQPPIGPIEIAVDSVENGAEPSEDQIKFCQDFEKNIAQVIERCRGKINDIYKEWTRKPLPLNIWDDLSLNWLSIPVDGDVQRPWGFCFSSKVIIGHFISVYFKNGAPSLVRVE